MAELNLITFHVLNFYSIVIQSRPFHPISTILIKLVQSLIACEPEPDPEMKKRVDWIYQNTHKKVNIPISIIELAVFKNLDKGLNREIDIGDHSFNLIELYKYLDEVTLELSTIVVEIAKKYNVEIPLSSFSGMGKTNVQSFTIE
jgi:hypothetical protein